MRLGPLPLRACILAACCLAVPAFAGTPVEAETGETKLAPEEAQNVLAELTESFSKQPCVRAKLNCAVEDLLGKREVRGEMLFKRPDTLLRRTQSGKDWTVVRLSGTTLREYYPGTGGDPGKLYEKDFGRAPKALALVRAGITLDVKALSKYFDLHLFKKPAEGGAPAQLRLVLARKEGVKLVLHQGTKEGEDLPYQYVIARLDEGAPFFRSIERLPAEGQGDPMTETFTEFKTDALADADFKDEKLDGKPGQVDQVKDLEE
ncbi:MAG: hypothetical protein M5U26_03080 [Planctomycetota bacterium]|nr:hypothetical protein [Planctomycetota bacterium]